MQTLDERKDAAKIIATSLWARCYKLWIRGLADDDVDRFVNRFGAGRSS